MRKNRRGFGSNAELVEWLRKKKRIFRELEEQLIRGLENPGTGMSLDELQAVVEHRARAGYVPPPGGRIHILRVPVSLDRPWEEAVKAAGLDTPNDYDVWKVGNLYPSVGTGTRKKEFVLLNFGPNGGSKEKADEWARQCGLKSTTPRDAFAIGKEKPNLHHELGMDCMYVVGTDECKFDGHRRACGVGWDGSEREADLNLVGNFGDPCDWFAFARD